MYMFVPKYLTKDGQTPLDVVRLSRLSERVHPFHLDTISYLESLSTPPNSDSHSPTN
jgi:hypothetical protein